MDGDFEVGDSKDHHVVRFDWLRKAAEQDTRESDGDDRERTIKDAQGHLARCYYDGEGTSQNTTEAIQLLRTVLSDKLEAFPDASDRKVCLLYTSPSPRDQRGSRMPSSA